jgi:hypothetical protein
VSTQAPTACSQQPGRWTLSASRESCDAACGRLDGKYACVLEEFQSHASEVDTNAKMKAVIKSQNQTFQYGTTSCSTYTQCHELCPFNELRPWVTHTPFQQSQCWVPPLPDAYNFVEGMSCSAASTLDSVTDERLCWCSPVCNTTGKSVHPTPAPTVSPTPAPTNIQGWFLGKEYENCADTCDAVGAVCDPNEYKNHIVETATFDSMAGMLSEILNVSQPCKTFTYCGSDCAFEKYLPWYTHTPFQPDQCWLFPESELANVEVDCSAALDDGFSRGQRLCWCTSAPAISPIANSGPDGTRAFWDGIKQILGSPKL